MKKYDDSTGTSTMINGQKAHSVDDANMHWISIGIVKRKNVEMNIPQTMKLTTAS